VAVADAFDAMTSTRAYRERQDPRWAYGELDRGSGTHFDPEVVAAFKRAFPPPSTDGRA
jgi:HD-GYP domain-containing protein (c-di-GMP phosphodiesterase class II)